MIEKDDQEQASRSTAACMMHLSLPYYIRGEGQGDTRYKIHCYIATCYKMYTRNSFIPYGKE